MRDISAIYYYYYYSYLGGSFAVCICIVFVCLSFVFCILSLSCHEPLLPREKVVLYVTQTTIVYS